MQRPAKPRTPVRFRSGPPSLPDLFIYNEPYYVLIIYSVYIFVLYIQGIMIRIIIIYFHMILAGFYPAAVMANTDAVSLADEINRINANVIFMRHALAPGYGDPANFDINQCATQRNLDETGRNQAQFIGQYFINEDITLTDILSSQWCRCKDTATELGLGQWNSFAGLNSFFQDHADRTETLDLLSIKLDQIGENELVLMVTHQVVISAVTRHSTQSGGLILHNTRTGVSVPFTIKDL